MNSSTSSSSHLPDQIPVRSELNFQDHWDSAAVADLIRSKSRQGESPAFLFLGRTETELLRGHLAGAFGEEAVSTLKATYYQGLEVIPLETETFLYTGGRKVQRVLQDPILRRNPWQDAEAASLWSLRIEG